MLKNTIIAISGGSGSGKTTLAKLLKERFREDVTLISQDSYYRDLSHLSETQINETNFDHPDSIDCELMKNNVQSLKNGLAAEGPVYCFKTHTRDKTTTYLEPRSIIIIEGLYSFFDSELLQLADYTVYIEASDDIRLIRRIRRDVVERGRDVESVMSQYEATVRKMHIEYIDKQKYIADIVFENNGDVDLSDIIHELANNISNLNDKSR